MSRVDRLLLRARRRASRFANRICRLGGVRANDYAIDGIPVTDLSGRAVLNPSIEALEEVKMQVRSDDVETGRTGGRSAAR
jgi:hypothetical protein